jgi:1-deoxy-D-xylulose 5-phosphate reductoisomerase
LASGLNAILLACGKLIDYYSSFDEISVLRFVEQKLAFIPITDIIDKVLTDDPESVSESNMTIRDIHDFM